MRNYLGKDAPVYDVCFNDANLKYSASKKLAFWKMYMWLNCYLVLPLLHINCKRIYLTRWHSGKAREIANILIARGIVWPRITYDEIAYKLRRVECRRGTASGVSVWV